ncbi:acetone carboxylase subunit gamma [Cryobacterium aureum]|uniref:acetone carboxylase subunit gamma n=1 Tax=Cryobacterium aureum TaxID=995037 RepID=UPI000CF3F508|nr:acetone carboxylase subunit gamma [Cryobacterium aureum]
MQLLENLSVQDTGSGVEFVCDRCRHVLGPATTDYKSLCLHRERPIEEIGRLFEDPRRYIDTNMVFREFICPNCGGLFDTEINKLDEPPVLDISIQEKA